MKEEIFIEAYKHYMSGYPLGETLDSLSKKYGYKDKESYRSDLKNERKKRNLPNRDGEFHNEESSSYEEGNDFINIVCASKRILNKEDIIKQFNIDSTIWEIERFKVKSSEGYRKDRKVKWQVNNGGYRDWETKNLFK